MKIDPHQPIRQIAIEIDGAAQIFEKYEIDYYKGGEQSLKEACLGIGAPLEKVESELGGKEPLPLSWRQREPDWCASDDPQSEPQKPERGDFSSLGRGETNITTLY